MNTLFTAFTIGSTIYLMVELILLILMCLMERPTKHKPLMRPVNILTKVESILAFVTVITVIAYLILIL